MIKYFLLFFSLITSAFAVNPPVTWDGACSSGIFNIPLQACLATGGGGGAPASPSGSLQFNNAGAFGGSSHLNFNSGTNTLGVNAVSNFANPSGTPAMQIQGDATIHVSKWFENASGVGIIIPDSGWLADSSPGNISVDWFARNLQTNSAATVAEWNDPTKFVFDTNVALQGSGVQDILLNSGGYKIENTTAGYFLIQNIPAGGSEIQLDDSGDVYILDASGGGFRLNGNGNPILLNAIFDNTGSGIGSGLLSLDTNARTATANDGLTTVANWSNPAFFQVDANLNVYGDGSDYEINAGDIQIIEDGSGLIQFMATTTGAKLQFSESDPMSGAELLIENGSGFQGLHLLPDTGNLWLDNPIVDTTGVQKLDVNAGVAYANNSGFSEEIFQWYHDGGDDVPAMQFFATDFYDAAGSIWMRPQIRQTFDEGGALSRDDESRQVFNNTGSIVFDHQAGVGYDNGNQTLTFAGGEYQLGDISFVSGGGYLNIDEPTAQLSYYAGGGNPFFLIDPTGGGAAFGDINGVFSGLQEVLDFNARTYTVEVGSSRMLILDWVDDIFQMGDVDGINNGTTITVDDSNSVVEVSTNFKVSGTSALFNKGFVTLPPQTGGTPACLAKGEIAITSHYISCVCNGTSWVTTSTGTVPCSF